MRKLCLMVMVCLCVSIGANGQETPSNSDVPLLFNRLQMGFHNAGKSPQRLHLDIPLLDYTYQKQAAEILAKRRCEGCKPQLGDYLGTSIWPSMKQSQKWTTNFYNAAHFGIKKGITALLKPEKNPKARNLYTTPIIYLLSGLMDYSTNQMPFAITWGHEEFHKNNLTVNDIYSFNDVYRWGETGGPLNVSKVTDADLTRMKAENNPSLVRAHASGGENDLEVVTSLQKENFFYDLDLPHFFMYWYGTIAYISYVRSNDDPELDNEFYEEYYYPIEGDDVELRDYVGQDYAAWVYDLFRPNEAYEERGTHPSGVGIKRYISVEDMTDEEIAYLGKQGKLTLLNLISPFLLGIDAIRLSEEKRNGAWYGNFHVRHHLTSFGHDIELGIFLKNNRYKLLASLHNYKNHEKHFPGFGIELIDYAIDGSEGKVLLGGELSTWIQPENHEFRTTTGKAGLLANLRLSLPLNEWLHAYVELEGKTQGWVAGNPYLGKNVNGRLGLSMSF